MPEHKVCTSEVVYLLSNNNVNISKFNYNNNNKLNNVYITKSHHYHKTSRNVIVFVFSDSYFSCLVFFISSDK